MITLIDRHRISDIVPLWMEYAKNHQHYDQCFELRTKQKSDLEAYLLSDWLFPGHYSLGYYSSNRIIAFICWATADFPFPHKSMPHGKILDLFVSPSYRRRGIATALFRETESWLHQRAIRRIQLTVAALNADAISFWRSKDFGDFLLELKRE
jgi:GNAT superfamily N-acetyltransferase